MRALKNILIVAAAITITASPQEVQQLGQMLEQYEKACSIWQPMTQCAVPPVQWEMKLQQAVDEANKPATEAKPTEPPK